MEKVTEEVLGMLGFRFDLYAHWDTYSAAASHLCFDNSNPIKILQNLASWDVRNKIYSEINEIVFDKTNNQNITESLKT